MSTRNLNLVCDELATLLSYPDSNYHSMLQKAVESSSSRKSAKALRTFQESIANLSESELQEFYSSTFDLNPLCSPALSVHLFGVESFKRSHLMVGLLDMYRAADFQTVGETADHMSTVVRFLSHSSSEEREEIAQFILLPGLTKIAEFLESKSNSFSHLVKAAAMIVAAETGKEAKYA